MPSARLNRPKIANVFALHGGQAEQAGGRYKE